MAHTETHTHVVLSSHLERIAITSFLTYFFLCFPALRSCCHCISDTPLTELKMEENNHAATLTLITVVSAEELLLREQHAAPLHVWTSAIATHSPYLSEKLEL